ncbi:MAG: hypothetical protein HY308_09310 [Gammaproteobacteria bacterium]|nr:hypothetical protein [Gammaproteobacteria bacterium]
MADLKIRVSVNKMNLSTLSLSIALIITPLFTAGCNAQTQKPLDPTANRQQVVKMESMTGMKLPADAEILLDEDAGRQVGEYHVTVIHSKATIAVPTKVRSLPTHTDSDSTLHRILSNRKIGKIKNMTMYVGDWVTQKGSWSSTLYETETGFYLQLENSKPVE